MEHRKLGNEEKPYEGCHDFDVLMSFVFAVACLEILENLIREGATPTNIARQTGLMRMAVENARDELGRREMAVPQIGLVAVSRGV